MTRFLFASACCLLVLNGPLSPRAFAQEPDKGEADGDEGKGDEGKGDEEAKPADEDGRQL